MSQTEKPGSEQRPLLPAVRIRIGVTGHRNIASLAPDKHDAIRTSVELVLDAVVASVSGGAAAVPDVSVLSCLAEGADRLVGEAGLARGYSLEAVLPFGRAEYANDFKSPVSRAAFEALLAKSASVFELDGDPASRPRAYEAAGYVLLSNVDILIGIWDGEAGRGIGGTAAVVERAVAEGMPVVWIDPKNPKHLEVSGAGDSDFDPTNQRFRETFTTVESQELRTTLRKVLAPQLEREAQACLDAYALDGSASRDINHFYPKVLSFIIGGGFNSPSNSVALAVQKTREKWERYLSDIPADKSQRAEIERTLLPAYAAADHLAVYYQRAFRTAYTVNFSLAAAAVIAAAVGGAFYGTGNYWLKWWFVLLEFVIAWFILATWWLGRRQQWHRRWLEYRRLAESLRQIRILAPMGLSGPIERSAGHLSIRIQDWVNWYVYSLRRTIPLPDQTVTNDYLGKVCASVLSNEIAGQINYHAGRLQIAKRKDHWMHWGGASLFVLTIALCFWYLVTHFSGETAKEAGVWPSLSQVFTALTIILPTIASALGAIHVQSDHRSAVEQSERIGRRLKVLEKIMQEEAVSFARLADRVEKATEVFMADVNEWQTVFRTRPLSLPA